MKKFSVLLPAILLAVLLAIGVWGLIGRFRATRDEIRSTRTVDDPTLVDPKGQPVDSLSEKEE